MAEPGHGHSPETSTTTPPAEPRRIEGARALQARRLARLLEIEERGVGGEADAIRRFLTQRAERILSRGDSAEMKRQDLLRLAVEAKRALTLHVNTERYRDDILGLRRHLNSAGGKALAGALSAGIGATGVLSVGSGVAWGTGLRLMTEAYHEWRSGSGEHRQALDEPDAALTARLESQLTDAMLSGRRDERGVMEMLKAVVDGVFKHEFTRLMELESRTATAEDESVKRLASMPWKQRVFALLALSPMDLDGVPEALGVESAAGGSLRAHLVGGLWRFLRHTGEAGRWFGSVGLNGSNLLWHAAMASVNVAGGLVGFELGNRLARWAKGEPLALDTSWTEMTLSPKPEPTTPAAALATPGRRHTGSVDDFPPYFVPPRKPAPDWVFAAVEDHDEEGTRPPSTATATRSAGRAATPSDGGAAPSEPGARAGGAPSPTGGPAGRAGEPIPAGDGTGRGSTETGLRAVKPPEEVTRVDEEVEPKGEVETTDDDDREAIWENLAKKWSRRVQRLETVVGTRGPTQLQEWIVRLSEGGNLEGEIPHLGKPPEEMTPDEEAERKARKQERDSKISAAIEAVIVNRALLTRLVGRSIWPNSADEARQSIDRARLAACRWAVVRERFNYLRLPDHSEAFDRIRTELLAAIEAYEPFAMTLSARAISERFSDAIAAGAVHPPVPIESFQSEPPVIEPGNRESYGPWKKQLRLAGNAIGQLLGQSEPYIADGFTLPDDPTERTALLEQLRSRRDDLRTVRAYAGQLIVGYPSLSKRSARFFADFPQIHERVSALTNLIRQLEGKPASGSADAGATGEPGAGGSDGGTPEESEALATELTEAERALIQWDQLSTIAAIDDPVQRTRDLQTYFRQAIEGNEEARTLLDRLVATPESPVTFRLSDEQQHTLWRLADLELQHWPDTPPLTPAELQMVEAFEQRAAGAQNSAEALEAEVARVLAAVTQERDRATSIAAHINPLRRKNQLLPEVKPVVDRHLHAGDVQQVLQFFVALTSFDRDDVKRLVRRDREGREATAAKRVVEYWSQLATRIDDLVKFLRSESGRPDREGTIALEQQRELDELGDALLPRLAAVRAEAKRIGTRPKLVGTFELEDSPRDSHPTLPREPLDHLLDDPKHFQLDVKLRSTEERGTMGADA